jgi:hypothetical protein
MGEAPGDEAPSVVDIGDAVTVMSEAELVLKHVGGGACQVR